MSDLTPVYDGLDSSKLNKEDLIKAILREYEVAFEENTLTAMRESFRCGFLRGEEFAQKEMWK